VKKLVLFVAIVSYINAGLFDFETIKEANQAYSSGKFAKSTTLYKDLLKSKDNKGLHYDLANSYYKKGDYENAIFHFNEALRFPRNFELMRDGKEKEAYYYLALTYKAMGKKEKAEEYFKKLLEIAPVDAANSWGAQDWIEITYYKMLAANELGMNELAAEIHVSLWDKSNAYLNKTYHSALDWRSVRQRMMKKEDKAYGYFSLGLFYYAAGEYTRAIDNFKKTLEILPAYFSAKDFLDMAMEKQNNAQ